VRGRIGRTQVGLDLDDAALGPFLVDRRDQPCAEKFRGDNLCRSGEESALEGGSGRRPRPPLGRLGGVAGPTVIARERSAVLAAGHR
jgi:hypothetical protein